jgi:hypothetical protein
MRSLRTLGIVAAAMALAPPLAAQTDIAPDPGSCTVGCACSPSMCGCSRKGGSGGACRSDGDSCVVFACAGSLVQPGTDFVLAADGAPVTVRAGAAAGDRSARVAAVRAVRWRTVGRGHSVGLNCLGAVVSEYFDPRRADALRRRSRQLTL